MRKFSNYALVAAAFVGAMVFAGCTGDDNGGGGGTPPDGGLPDGTVADGGAVDGTASDAPATDATMNDAGATDGASTDGAPTDGAPTDSAPQDVVAPQCTLYDAAGLDEASVAAGFQAVWKVYRCWGCHQKASQIVDDAGNGIVLSGNNDGLGDSGMVFPPNLTGDPSTGLGCWTDQDLTGAILHGKEPDGSALCPSMPKWGNALTVADGGPRPGTPMDASTAQEIVEYLRSLPAVKNQVTETTCPHSGGDAGADAGSDAQVDASDAAVTDAGGGTDAADAAADATDAADAASE